MDNIILSINPGSSSVKFSLFINRDGVLHELHHGAVESIDSNPSLSINGVYFSSIDSKNTVNEENKDIAYFDNAYESISTWLITHLECDKIDKVCYRIVHGGDFYNSPQNINNTVLRNLTSLIPFAPLHQSIGLEAIKHFMEKFSKSNHIACFDTAFHRTMPKISQTFALPSYLRKKGIKPYGFHGLSYQYIVGILPDLYKGIMPRRTIIAHLGSGASMCALLNGESINTSMTFSPLDGLTMSTRCGTIDAGAVIYLIDKLKISPAKVSHILNKESGLLGLSGISGDVKTLLKNGGDSAEFALEFYVARITRELGAMVATLRGLDTLIFTGGVGSNSAEIRDKICSNLDWLGISIDSPDNNKNSILISKSSSHVDVFSLKTNEELLMAKLVSPQGEISEN